ncbi:MAG: GntR family transcriptional regulator [Actinomycetia bacterium]|nr:GntR family transcriptional regulator [Actinomycetes bacterium]
MPDFKLDQLSATPLWEQLTRQLRDAIVRGDLPPDRKLPTEARIAEDHGIGRGTAARAFGTLREEGWAVWVPGRGLFTAPAEAIARLKREARKR